MTNGIDKEQVKKAYESGEGTFRVLSEKYNVSEGTIKSWAKQDKDKGQPWIKPTQPKPKNQNKRLRKKVEVEEVKELIVKDSNETLELPEKQRLFVAEYLKDFNATRAAMTVGYSKNTAKEQGCRLLTHANVQREVKRQTEVLFDSIGLSAQRILMEYMKIAYADINDYLDFGQKEMAIIKNGEPLLDKEGNPVVKTTNYVNFKDSSEVDTSLIQEVKLGKDGASIKLYDKMKAMEMLAKYMNLIVDKNNVNMQQNNITINNLNNMTEEEINKQLEALENNE